MIKKFLLAISGLTLFVMPVMIPRVALADDPKAAVCAGVEAAGGTDCGSGGGTVINGAVKTALRLLQVIAGLLAVFYMIYAGIKFVTSGGSSDGIKSAKGTILYASIGLVVVAISEAVIQFVLKRFG